MELENHELDVALQILRDQRNVDLAGFRRGRLKQQLEHRAVACEAGSIAEYLEHLPGNARELDALLRALRMQATGFFRDPELWKRLQTTILPALIENRREIHSLRMWSAGCANGQEAYSLAIATGEALGPENPKWNVRIFATNMDRAAIQQARRGAYPRMLLKGMPERHLERWFVPRADGKYQIRRELRKRIIFGINDLLEDPAYPHMDLILCRNVLIYFERKLQAKILHRFRHALAPDGFLVLGGAEIVPARDLEFVVVDPANRIYGANHQRTAA